MSTHTIKGYLYHIHYEFQQPHEFQITFHPSATMGENTADWTLIREHSFEVEIADDFDPCPQKIVALEAMKQKVRAEFAERIRELDDQLSKLQALEYSGSEA